MEEIKERGVEHNRICFYFITFLKNYIELIQHDGKASDSTGLKADQSTRLKPQGIVGCCLTLY